MWLLLIGILALAGCQPQEGSESAARQYLAAEMQKWMTNQETAARPHLYHALPPLSYTIESVLPTTPSGFAHDKLPLPENTEGWPAYQFNGSLQLLTEAKTSREQVQRYRLTWSPPEKRWFLDEVR